MADKFKTTEAVGGIWYFSRVVCNIYKMITARLFKDIMMLSRMRKPPPIRRCFIFNPGGPCTRGDRLLCFSKFLHYWTSIHAKSIC
ncbi:hypothetical protein BDE02_19G087600 [Populus trichocarpa]|nr:hypothetical protein BDE02_19G087600 [Populus trichocarpa]